MKKSLLLVSALLMCATGAFAQWVKPVPTAQAIATDGTPQYLYNVEAGAYLIGANDWGTRASVTSKGYKVKFTHPEGDEEGTLAETYKFEICLDGADKWNDMDCQGYDQLWVDGGGRAGSGMWSYTALPNGSYEITNANVTGKLSAVGLWDGAANNRLFMIDPSNEALLNQDEELRYEGAYSEWQFVSEAEYEALLPKISAYNAAMDLKAKIDEAKEKYEGIDLSAAEAIFNDTNNPDSVLIGAKDIVAQAIVDFQKGGASAENPADFSDLIAGGNVDFEEGTSGWTSTTGCQNNGTATNKANANDYAGTTFTGKFYENWDPSAFSGKISTTVTGLPGGVYKMTLDATANAGNNTWVFANNDSVRTNGVDADGVGGYELGDLPRKFTIWTIVGEEGTLEMGIKNPDDCCNWIGIDNASLTYYGDKDDAYKLWYTDTRTQIIETMNALIDEDTKYDKSQKDVFYAALAKGDAAQTREELLAAIEGLKAASNATLASIEAYGNLEALVLNIGLELVKGASGYAELFEDVLTDDPDAAAEALAYLAEAGVPEELIVEEGPLVVLDKCSMTTEEVTAYTEKLAALWDYCYSNSIKEGDDITSKLVNPNFTDGNGAGWTAPVKGVGAWTGGIHSFPVAESYHAKFDFYQELENMPNGIYSLSLNGFCRLDDGDTEVAAEIYLNDFSTPFTEITTGKILKENAVDGWNCYLTPGADGEWTKNPLFQNEDGTPVGHNSPNNAADSSDEEGYWPNGMEGASVAFSADRYKATVYGVVEDGKLKIGARNEKSTHQWALWGNFRLKYEGESEEAVDALAKVYVGQAEKFLEDNEGDMSTPAIADLQKKIATVAILDDPSEKFAAIKAMNAEVQVAKANVEAVKAFHVAKDAMDSAASDNPNPSAEALAKYYELAGIECTDMTTEQINAAIEELNACAGLLRIPAHDNASDANPVDFTAVIVNPTFDVVGDFHGWQGDSFGAGGTTAPCAERYDMTFNTYQDLAGLPEGTYGLSVQGFYREGSAENDYAVFKGEAEHKIDAHLYATSSEGTSSLPLPKCAEGALPVSDCPAGSTVAVGSGTVVPNSMEAANNWFERGLYKMPKKVYIHVPADGKLRIGVRKDEKIGGDWVLLDNFHLEYYGKNSVGVNDIQTAAAKTVNIYTASGAKVAGLQKGINILKMSDGTVKKVLVK